MKLIGEIRKQILSLSFIVIISIIFLIGVYTVHGLSNLSSYTRTIYNHPLVVSNASLKAALNITKMHRNMKDVVLSNTVKEMNTSIELVTKNESKVYEQLDLIKENILGIEGQKLQAETRNLFISWKPIREEVIKLYTKGSKAEAISITKEKGANHVNILETKMLELMNYARTKATSFLKEAERKELFLEHTIIILISISLLLSITIAVITTGKVKKSERTLQQEKEKLQEALSEIKTLQGIIPICSYCKQIRDDEGLWNALEEYIRQRSEAVFSHSICPDCLRKHFPELAEKKKIKP